MLEAKNYIPWILEKRIEAYAESPEIMAIIGPRQCGKTRSCTILLLVWHPGRKISLILKTAMNSICSRMT